MPDTPVATGSITSTITSVVLLAFVTVAYKLITAFANGSLGRNREPPAPQTVSVPTSDGGSVSHNLQGESPEMVGLLTQTMKSLTAAFGQIDFLERDGDAAWDGIDGAHDHIDDLHTGIAEGRYPPLPDRPVRPIRPTRPPRA